MCNNMSMNGALGVSYSIGVTNTSNVVRKVVTGREKSWFFNTRSGSLGYNVMYLCNTA